MISKLPPRARTVLMFLLLLAFAVRVIGLGYPSLWYEEGYSIQFAAGPALSFLTDAPRLELNTPLYYFVLKGWLALAGSSEFAARLLSVFAGVVTAAIAARMVKGKNSFAIAVVGLSAACAFTSQEVRMYALAAAFCTLAAWLWQRALTRQGGRAWAFWGLAAGLAVLTHVLTAIPCAIQLTLGAWHLLRTRASRRAWRPFLIVSILVSAGVLGVGAFVLAFAGGYGSTFTGMLNPWTTLRDSVAAQLLPRALPETLRLAAFGALIAVIAGALWVGESAQRRMIAMALLSLCGIAVFSIFTGKFAPRYATIVTPILLAALVAPPDSVSAFRQVPRWGVLALTLVALFLWRTLPAYATEDFRAAAAYVRKEVRADETVLILPGYLSPAFGYYFGSDGWTALPPDRVLDVRNVLDFVSANRMLNQALAGKLGVWVFAWEDDVVDPSHVTVALLRRQAHLLNTVQDVNGFNGPRLLHFRFDAPYEPGPEGMPSLDSRVEASGAPRGLDALGCAQLRESIAAHALMEIACFWELRPDNRLPYNTQVSLRLSDMAGRRLTQFDTQLAPDGLPYYPYSKTLTAIYFVPLPAGTAPGEYELVAIPYTPEGEIAPRIVTRVLVNP